ncbi:MAG: hypothetical protein GY864_06410 [Desulfobacterales bacterium]|nr:hypothetical protein [Desulfobacterales bacterium]
MVNYGEYIDSAIHVLNIAQVDLMEVPEMDRGKALDLEAALTETADRQDSDGFFNLLDRWRATLIKHEGLEQFFQKKAA